MLLWSRMTEEGGGIFMPLPCTPGHLREFSSYTIHGPRLILWVTSELYQKERPLNSAPWQVNCYLRLPSEMLRNTVPGTQLICLSGSISDRSFVSLSPIRLKPACNDKLSVSDLSIRNISLKICSDSHGCFILTNLVVLGFFWWNWNKEDPDWCVSGRKETYC